MSLDNAIPRQKDPGPDEPGVRYGNKKRIKGLEFKAVALLYNDVESDDVGGRFAHSVAATRARQNLLIISLI